MKVPSKNAVILGVVAITIAYHSWNLFGKTISKTAPGTTTTPAAPAATTTTPATASPGAPAAAPATTEPDRPIDEALIRANLRLWTESPRRDPFEARLLTKAVRDERPPASALLTLQALWRQTGGQFAIINDRILVVGESVSGFDVEQIDDATVWVRSPRGRERIELRAPNLNPVAGPPGDSANTNNVPRTKAPRPPAVPKERRFSP